MIPNYKTGDSYTQEDIEGVTYTVVNVISTQTTYALPTVGSFLSDGVAKSTGFFKINNVSKIQSNNRNRYSETPIDSNYNVGVCVNAWNVITYTQPSIVYLRTLSSMFTEILECS